MAKNIVYLCKNKLNGIDSILPIMMEIRRISPVARFFVVFLDNKHLDAVRKNYNIWSAVKSLDAKIIVIRDGNRFITLTRLIYLIGNLIFKDNVIFENADTLPLHSIVMRLLKKVSKAIIIKAYLALQSPVFLKNIYIQSALKREREGRSEADMDFFNGCYDYFLSALNVRQFRESFNAEAPAHKMVYSGYTRKLPAWRKFTDESAGKNAAINERPYFLYILHASYQRRGYLNEPDLIELVRESLDVFKKYNSEIRTILKPHSITDMEAMKSVLWNIGYSNYIIDYGHPMVLSSKARFIFGNVFSCTMFDAYYQGIPVVEYCQYDPELYERLHKQSIGAKFCDFFIYRDAKKLDEVLRKLINGEIEVERDPEFMRENYPNTPPQFYDFLHKLLS